MNGWECETSGDTRTYKREVGEATVIVELSDVYKDSTSKLPSLAVQGSWRIENHDFKVPLREVTDDAVLRHMEKLIYRQFAVHEKRELYRASRGGEIIKKKGRYAVNPFTT